MGMHVFTVFSLSLVQRQAEIDNISKWKGNQDNFQQGQLFIVIIILSFIVIIIYCYYHYYH